MDTYIFEDCNLKNAKGFITMSHPVVGQLMLEKANEEMTPAQVTEHLQLNYGHEWHTKEIAHFGLNVDKEENDVTEE